MLLCSSLPLFVLHAHAAADADDAAATSTRCLVSGRRYLVPFCGFGMPLHFLTHTNRSHVVVVVGGGDGGDDVGGVVCGGIVIMPG